MNTRFIHPLWTHLPAVLALLAGVVFTLMAMPLPDPSPVHFNMSGQPDRYGSPWMSTIMLAGLSILYIIISFILDEAWARQEKCKTFNWLSLFDDVTVAALVAVQVTYVNMLASSDYVYQFPWVVTIAAIALAAGAAVILEKIRPYRRFETGLVIEDVSQLEAEVARIVEAGQPLVYWEGQNPTYSKALSIAMPVLMGVIAITAFYEVPWFAVLFGLIAVAFGLTYGGFRTLVTRESVTLRMGILGIRLLNLQTADIGSAELHNFAPLRDFGGYGIRFNKEMKAFFLSGDRGVKITTRAGQRYLIGSDHPERLAAVISAVIH